MTATLTKTERCPDCQASIGQPHLDGCDTARCLWTGEQRIQCKWYGEDSILTEHDCGQDTWTGHWPGEVEAVEFDWWIYWDGPCPEKGWDYRGQGWVRCDRDHPEARPDLNRLHIEARWDRRAHRWVR